MERRHKTTHTSNISCCDCEDCEPCNEHQCMAMELEQEVRLLRKQVKEFEIKVSQIQCEFRENISQILEEYFGFKADQIASKQQALEVEQDVCQRFLLKSLKLFEDIDKNGHQPTSAEVVGLPVRTPSHSSTAKRKRKPSGFSDLSENSANNVGTCKGLKKDKNIGRRRPKPKPLPAKRRAGEVYNENDGDTQLLEEEQELVESEVDNRTPIRREVRKPLQERAAGAATEGVDYPDDYNLLTNDYGVFTADGKPLVFEEFRGASKNLWQEISSVWKYFLLDTSGTYAQCRVDNCGRIFHNRPTTSTSTLRTVRAHLKGIHKINIVDQGQQQQTPVSKTNSQT